MRTFVNTIKSAKNTRADFFIKMLRNLNFLFSDKIYLQLMFRCKMGYKLDLSNPKSFSEKIQWLKLNNRNPLYTTLVDKYAVKNYVAKIIGEDHIIPILGVWNSAEKIDFDSLPNKFVLKTTNGGGGNVLVCKNKLTLNREASIKKMDMQLKQRSIYKTYREWPYKNVTPRIIAEKYMEDENGELNDYKFFCFNGKPQYCQVIRDRFTKETIDFYDLEWNHMPFVGLNPVVENGLNPVEKPRCLKALIEACESLSEGIPFVRVDFFVINNQFYFGEMTFYPASGLGEFRPMEWNNRLGDLIKLPIK
ncbi:hypothetical protein IKQ19_10490 [Candidatus Saccharibacteria bacterium]|nr:hypothetical protein [Candidatus Saccharibacteria bacterium]